ncbi:methyltransferase domain-containing protein [uncultured Desulfosarcina sp.]|uniref:class I SAM-dependent methyltransferase n=1 Tax=uncultured Desulfosarcina sp. TaxID=218289 RepID=UPI0029C66146|nr:methyltransferase domain-containing protein [uncultured Desulfosarcina sp.]
MDAKISAAHFNRYMSKKTSTHCQNSISGKGVFPPRYAFTLLIPFRNLFLSPKKLIHRLELKENFNVLEIGPGPGYFSPHIARKIPNGKLVLLDIQEEMLNFAKKRLQKRKINNVVYLLTSGSNFDIDSHFFDRVFMVTVIGEVENKEKYLQEIHRVMKMNGILSISELAGDPDKLDINELQSLVTKFGFKTKKIFGNKRNYTINFNKI